MDSAVPIAVALTYILSFQLRYWAVSSGLICAVAAWAIYRTRQHKLKQRD